MPDRHRPHARVFFEDGTILYAAYDADASTVDAALFGSMDRIGTASASELADRSRHLPAGPDDLRAVHTGYGTAVVPLSACERVVVEANDSRRADWWTALAFRGSKVLATNLDGSEVYLKHAGLFRPNPENGVDGGPRVTGVPFGEVDFRDLDSEHVRPEGIDLPGPGL